MERIHSRSLEICYFLTRACAPQLDMTVFRCTHARLTEVPLIIHRNTLELDLSHNLIEVLHEDSFNRLHGLRKLTLSHNKIYKITERAFLPVAQSLTFLDLGHNQLMSTRVTSFPVTALAPLTHLTDLYLSNNPIGLLPSGFLRYLGANLTHLEISSSSLEMQIQDGAFRGLARLHHLNLAHNIFSEFNEDSFDGLRPEQFSRISLQGVQWHCDCRILWLRRWLNRVPRKALYADPLPGGECITPNSFKGQSLLFLNMTDLQCAPRLISTTPPGSDVDPLEPIHVVGLQRFNLTLACTFISEPKMQVEWYQNGVLVQPHWTRLKQTTTSGTKFTTSLHFQQLDGVLDEGLYQCQTTNQKGAARANFMVQIDTNEVDENRPVNTPPSINRQTPMSKAEEMGRYLIIVGIIVAANIIFVIVGATTYNCVRYRYCIFPRHPHPPTDHQKLRPELGNSCEPSDSSNLNHEARYGQTVRYSNSNMKPYHTVGNCAPLLPSSAEDNYPMQTGTEMTNFGDTTGYNNFREEIFSRRTPHKSFPLRPTFSPYISQTHFQSSDLPSVSSTNAECSVSILSPPRDRAPIYADRVTPSLDPRLKSYYMLTVKHTDAQTDQLAYKPLTGTNPGLDVTSPAENRKNPLDAQVKSNGSNLEQSAPIDEDDPNVPEELDPNCPIHGLIANGEHNNHISREDPENSENLGSMRTLHTCTNKDMCPIHGISTDVDLSSSQNVFKRSDKRSGYCNQRMNRHSSHLVNAGSDCPLLGEWKYGSQMNLRPGYFESSSSMDQTFKAWNYNSRVNTLPR
ncbi:unnamed protein product [Calicophoron daubneyi]|uniref:Ig-like domain-containing protein n=1 Tax=Calicophoron daubneyi TaxID=300641 RepID=A0AAV2TNB9_CALDB